MQRTGLRSGIASSIWEVLPYLATTSFVAGAFAVLARDQAWSPLRTVLFGALALVLFAALVLAPIGVKQQVERSGNRSEADVRIRRDRRLQGPDAVDAEFSRKLEGPHELTVAEQAFDNVASLAPEWANLLLTTVVAAYESRDPYLRGHSVEVAAFAADIAQALGLPKNQQRLARLAGIAHDVGKIGLPPDIQMKPGQLTLQERRIMEGHSEIGERIVSGALHVPDLADAVRHHHERWDGLGYPDGLSGSDIPILSRLVAVPDAFSAMTSPRPYRDALPERIALLRLVQAGGTQFDRDVVATFVSIVENRAPTDRPSEEERHSWETYFQVLATGNARSLP